MKITEEIRAFIERCRDEKIDAVRWVIVSHEGETWIDDTTISYSDGTWKSLQNGGAYSESLWALADALGRGDYASGIYVLFPNLKSAARVGDAFFPQPTLVYDYLDDPEWASLAEED